MHAVSFLRRPEVAQHSALPAANGSGALIAGRLDGLSGRPSCRIYPVGKGWRLEIERTSAWLAGLNLPGHFRCFRSLAAAVGFAESHGLNYRIIRPTTLFAANRRRSMDSMKRREWRRQLS
ncbi:MAG: hypothetical protein JSR78_10695 [Proteobacteria bacterium]|nr:hypothetical protein [Pseudomonadota bacterium]